MRKILGCLFLMAAVSSPVEAQVQDESLESDAVTSFSTVPDRKHPGFWRRPTFDHPEKQLAYAQELQREGKQRRAARAYRAVVHQWHEAPEAVAAQLAYSRLLEERGKHVQAFEEYQYLIHYYPLQIDYEKVLERQFALANEVMTARRMTLFVFKGFVAPERAVGMFEQIVRNAPQWTRAPEAQYRVGWIREQVHDYQAAAAAYRVVMDQYAESSFADTAAFRRAYCLYRMAKKKPRDEQACRNALSAVSVYLSRYAASDAHRAEAEAYLEELNATLAEMYLERARFYDRTGRPEAAILAYRDFVKKFPDAPSASEAITRIESLRSRSEQDDEKNE